MKGQGFTIIGVNGNDRADTVRSYRKSGPFTFPLVMNGKGKDDVGTKYGVTALPTSYLLDTQGRVVARYIGYDEKVGKDMQAALRKMGLKPR